MKSYHIDPSEHRYTTQRTNEKFKLGACDRPQARETGKTESRLVVSDWLIKWASFLNQSQSEVKRNHCSRH